MTESELTEAQQSLLDSLPDEYKGTSAEFAPWKVLNQLMIESFRVEVVRGAMNNMNQIGGRHKATIQRMVRKHAKVPGFRNPARAPIQMQIHPAADVFKAEDDMVSAVLALWAEANGDLRAAVHGWLAKRDWQAFTADVDRSVLPGWIITWPESTDLQDLGDLFISETDSEASRDEVCLMICWVSARVPLEMPDDDAADDSEE